MYDVMLYKDITGLLSMEDRLQELSIIGKESKELSVIVQKFPIGEHLKEPHYHSTEKIILVIKGQGKTYYGDNLEKEIAFGPGDLIFVPRCTVHMPVNIGQEPIISITITNTNTYTYTYLSALSKQDLC